MTLLIHCFLLLFTNSSTFLIPPNFCIETVLPRIPHSGYSFDIKYNQVHVGVYASVEHGGIIRRGDTIRVEEKNKEVYDLACS
jgi:hypothetical protein